MDPGLEGRIRIAIASALAALLLLLAPPAMAQPADAPKSATALITGYYQSALGRAPDPGGLAYWEGQVALVQSLGADVNETFRALAIAFYNSPEYRSFNRSNDQYLRDLYATFFNRPADAGGLAYWGGQLQAGQTRESVLLWFLFSAEFNAYMAGIFGPASARPEADMVIDFYRGFFGRLPDEGGFRYWVARLRAAQCSGATAVVAEIEALSNAFLVSADYANRRRLDHEFLTDMYNAFMRRGPDLPGFMEWGQRLRYGTYTRDAVRRAFVASPEFQVRVQRVVSAGCFTLAEESNLAAVVADQSVSPFIAVLELRGAKLDAITGVSFAVRPRPGTVSRAVAGSYSGAWLARRGYGASTSGYRLPVFGLYHSYANTVTVRASFSDGSVRALDVPVSTGAFTHSAAIYYQPTVLQARQAGATVDFDFFYIKSLMTTPIVMDTDGHVRWWVPGDAFSVSTLFHQNGFQVAVPPLRWLRRELDGALTETTIATNRFQTHHNLDPGRTGVLVELDDRVNGVIDPEHIVAEVAPDGSVIKEWNLGALLSSYMAANGDDPSKFVRFGVDWFHMNAATYDPRDDTLILSGRESFVIKIRYLTGEIVWILGDPTKYWYKFPSLRAKALTLAAPGLVPIGQHSTSLTPEGDLMIFNNGRASLNMPAGEPAGEERPYSVVSTYRIDPATMTAHEVRSFDYNRTIRSRFCSSAYRAGGSTLVTYTLASDGAKTRFVGLDANQQVVFDLEVVNAGGCNTGWNAAPLPFENLVFD